MHEPNHDLLEQLKNDYQQIPIPKELDMMIQNTLERDANERRRQKRLHTWRNIALTAAAVAALFVGSHSPGQCAWSQHPGGSLHLRRLSRGRKQF